MDRVPAAPAGGPALRRWGGAAAAALVFLVALAVPAAGRAAPQPRAVPPRTALTGPAGDSPGALAALEARAARLAKRYRGEVITLTESENAALLATTRAARLRRQLGKAQRELARLAAASYMNGVTDPVTVLMGGASPTEMLRSAAALDYVTRQRDARERGLQRFMAADRRAEQAARARMGELRQAIAALTAQRHRLDALLAKFHPQSPVIGPNITPRMLQVKNAVDRQFGPFTAIGCYRAETSGEHPLGRACDFMLSTGGVMPTAANIQRGYAIASWAQAHAAQLGIMYIIYRQKIWDIRMPSAGWVPMADRGSITANHYDHMHISVF
ncbi:MAG: hypothetical protein ACM32E_17585 [Gemmatimonadota bacterium]